MTRPIENGRLDLELQALSVLAAAAEPVGSRRLSEALRDAGFDLAEATAGRLLRQFDRSGFTRAVGTKGRVLGAAGEQRLVELRRIRVQGEQSEQLVQAINASRVAEVVDLLHARRAVESETTRLAADHATDDELEQIAIAAGLSHDCATDGAARIDSSHAFHRLIAEASHNRLLIAFLQMLLDPVNDALATLMDSMAIPGDDATPSAFVDDHARLAEALRRRDGDAAAALMNAHFDRLIVAVRRQDARRAAAPE